MAQIIDPTVVLRIEGENLRELKRIYLALYHEPDFALTEMQKQARDETFNDYLIRQVSHEATSNRAREDDERRALHCCVFWRCDTLVFTMKSTCWGVDGVAKCYVKERVK